MKRAYKIVSNFFLFVWLSASLCGGTYSFIDELVFVTEREDNLGFVFLMIPVILGGVAYLYFEFIDWRSQKYWRSRK